jgi:ribosome maturation factor RimP
MRQELLDKVWEIADRVGRSEDIEIVDVEFLGGGRHRMLRIYIDKEGGVTHGDCENVSLQVGTILDIEDVIPGREYTLEVSSPGVERKLVRPKDYERFVGKQIKVVLREPVDNASHWIGTLRAFAENVATIETAKGQMVRVPLDKVKKANLKFEW